MLLRTLGAVLLRSLLTGKGTIRAGQDFNAATPFNKIWNTRVLSKPT